MPRQRPKGSTTTPLNLNNIPIALNPSPTTVKKSQSPVTSSETQFQSFPQPVFPPNNFPQPQPNLFPAGQEPPDKNLDNLFQSTVYPDPFRDEGHEAELDVSVSSPVSPEGALLGKQNFLGQGKTGLVESTSQCIVGTAETPPSTPTLAVPKGHRRNMSDTTAFNK